MAARLVAVDTDLRRPGPDRSTVQGGDRMISVLLVDDHPFVREQIKGLLCGTAGIEVVGECADGCEVVDVAAAVRPDVVLVDVQMPVMSGTAATRDLVAAQP